MSMGSSNVDFVIATLTNCTSLKFEDHITYDGAMTLDIADSDFDIVSSTH